MISNNKAEYQDIRYSCRNPYSIRRDTMSTSSTPSSELWKQTPRSILDWVSFPWCLCFANRSRPPSSRPVSWQWRERPNSLGNVVVDDCRYIRQGLVWRTDQKTRCYPEDSWHDAPWPVEHADMCSNSGLSGLFHEYLNTCPRFPLHCPPTHIADDNIRNACFLSSCRIRVHVIKNNKTYCETLSCG